MPQIPAATTTSTMYGILGTAASSSFHMLCGAWLLISVQLLLLNAGAVTPITVNKFPLLMPNVTPSHDESYLCTPVKVDYTKTYYIVGFEPKAKMDTAHHILIYGCGAPGSQKPLWSCGEMAHHDAGEETASPCGEGSNTQIIYAWARDAPRLALPRDVGFKVGKDSSIQYLVLQVHYAHVLPKGHRDSSGIILEHTEQEMPKQAGILLLGTGGQVGPQRTEHMEVSCPINEQKTIYPFAYRTHTHALGKVVSGYRVRTDASSGEDVWTLLGKRDPLTPQMFYPVMNAEPIRMGDRLTARCTMESHRDRITYIGSTKEDEMCNFYLMYYVDREEPLDMKYCFSRGPPTYFWRSPETGLHNIPELEASTL